MKKISGFTLVELLAVIVVLAVILVIAIPNVIKIIDKTRLDAYKRNEDMLVNATQKYMAQNGITLNTVGQTTTINYSDLKTNNLIANINDQTDNNESTKECSNSKVIVTKTTSGYSYKPGLVCTNYISLDTFNLVTNGNFSSGTSGWTLVNVTVSSGQAYFNSNANVDSYIIQNFGITRRMYVYCTISDYVSGKLRLNNSSSYSFNANGKASAIYTSNSILLDDESVQVTNFKVSNVIAIDMGEDASNPLYNKTLAEMDALINKSR